MTRLLTILLLLIISITSCSLLKLRNQTSLAKENTSPFGQVDYKDGGIYVELNNESYKWLKIDTIVISEIVNLFEENYNSKWQQRFSEDFVEYSNKLGVYPKQQDLFTLEDGNVKIIKLKFTSEKREKAKDHYESVYDQKINLDKYISRQEAFEDLKKQFQN